MNQKLPIEEQLEAWGDALRDRPRLTSRVMEEIRPAAGEGKTEAPVPRPSMPLRLRYLWAFAGTMLTLSLCVAIAVSIIPTSAVVWADVTQAVQSQIWIRGTSASSDGRQIFLWQSTERQV